MQTIKTEIPVTTFRQTTHGQLCPECGSIMEETDRLKEEGTLFIWYECSAKYCDATWLKAIRGVDVLRRG